VVGSSANVATVIATRTAVGYSTDVATLSIGHGIAVFIFIHIYFSFILLRLNPL
jgi:hypothetical protein